MESQQTMPVSYTTTTTTSTKVVVMPRFDPSYAKMIPGILKIVQIVLNLLGFICVMTSGLYYMSRTNWFTFVSMTGFWVTGILLILYFFHIVERFSVVPWMLAEFIYCAIWTLFYLIAASLVAAWGFVEAYSAAAFFGYMAMIAYGADAFFKFRGWRNGEPAQGQMIVTSSTVASPTGY